jgi:hypothetical protein
MPRIDSPSAESLSSLSNPKSFNPHWRAMRLGEAKLARILNSDGLRVCNRLKKLPIKSNVSGNVGYQVVSTNRTANLFSRLFSQSVELWIRERKTVFRANSHSVLMVAMLTIEDSKEQPQ